MILIYYDGSSGSTAAVDLAAQLWPGHTATILAVWQPGGPVADPEAPGHDAALRDAKAKRAASDRAKVGVAHALKAGLNVTSRVFAKDRSTAKTILFAAEGIGADLVVLGTSRLIGRDGVILGSVSRALVRHADLPVLVVPSRGLASKRRGAGLRRLGTWAAWTTPGRLEHRASTQTAGERARRGPLG